MKDNKKGLFTDKNKVDLADQTLQNLYLFNECFKIQIQCYIELEQYYALSHALDMYEHEIENVLTKEVQLAVDGYFRDPTNPFSTSVSEVIASVYQTNEFLLDNEEAVIQQTDLLSQNFSALQTKEMGGYHDSL